MDLTIILRTCGNGIFKDLSRISGSDRLTCVLKCITSLIESINNVKSKIPIKLYVLDDHSDREFLSKLNLIISKCQVPFELINVPDRPTNFKNAHNFSAYEQFRYGRDYAKGLVYFIEDDYLHSSDAIQTMLDTYIALRSMSDLNDVAIYPYDSTHNYNRNEPTRLFYINGRLWRGTTKSAFTMFIHSDNVRRYWPLFEKVSTDLWVDGTSEDTTINRMWNSAVIQSGPICLFSPIPSVAAHISTEEPIRLNTELNDWRERYNKIEIEETPAEFSWTRSLKI